MAEALKALRELLIGDSAPLLPFDASTITAQNNKVDEALKEASHSRGHPCSFSKN